MGEILRYLILKEQIKRFTRRLVERQFSQISVMILDTDRKRLAKRRQVTGYRSVFHEIVDFFKLDMPFNLPKNYLERQKLLEVTRTAKIAPRAKSRRTQSGQA